MNTVNKSTGFQLYMGRSPIIPLFVPAKSSVTVTDIDAWLVIQKVETDVQEGLNNFLCEKIMQYM